MADFGIWTKNVDIAAKAGANVNATAITIAETDKHVLQVEAFINGFCRFNFSDKVTAGMNVDFQGILEEVSTALCAIYAINYDMSGFSSRAEAESMMTTLRDAAFRGLGQLKDKKTQDFINAA